ncbi:MAG TPA: alpha/beta hydrolase, partial [Arthrobacter sp.]
MEWVPDILGDDFEACAFPAAGPDGVERTATLVRHVPGAGAGMAGERRARAVLFLHGWSDYFFNAELAEFWTGQGFAFFALDMHNHGRSLRADTHGGYVADLDDYDAEITAAIGIIASRHAGDAPPSVALMGHSTGGLIAALWASRHPGVVSQLILDSPWLEMHGSPALRRAARTMVEPLARFWPEAIIRLPERSFYWRSISSA